MVTFKQPLRSEHIYYWWQWRSHKKARTEVFTYVNRLSQRQVNRGLKVFCLLLFNTGLPAFDTGLRCSWNHT